LRVSALSISSQYVIFPEEGYTTTNPRFFDALLTRVARGSCSEAFTGYGRLRDLVFGEDDGRVQSQMRMASWVTAMARVELRRDRKKALNGARILLIDVGLRPTPYWSLPFGFFLNLSGIVGTEVAVNFAFRV
jgi:hypothetical protein